MKLFGYYMQPRDMKRMELKAIMKGCTVQDIIRELIKKYIDAKQAIIKETKDGIK